MMKLKNNQLEIKDLKNNLSQLVLTYQIHNPSHKTEKIPYKVNQNKLKGCLVPNKLNVEWWNLKKNQLKTSKND
jgi:hypothetical protein